jgi:hypothetical protein
MSSEYFVEFTAYVNERIRPEGFPREVKLQDTFLNVESTEHLQYLVNDRFVKLVTSAGLVVLKDPDAITTIGVITFDKRRFIPWHMLTHMEVKVVLIPAQVRPQDSIVPPNSEPDKKPKELVN